MDEKTPPPALDLFKTAHFRCHVSGEQEIDIPPTECLAEADLSRGDGGAWVQAWVWVDYDEV